MINTLKTRAEFQRVRGGGRFASPTFVLEGRQRRGAGHATLRAETAHSGPRFGFTVTKKMGNAVIRNRIRRRLKEAVRGLAARSAREDCDYVIVARSEALTRSFSEISLELEQAFDRVHRRLQGNRARPARR